MVRYWIYGLLVQSDVALPGVAPQPTDTSAAVDVFLQMEGTEPIPDEWEHLSWSLGRELQGDDWYLRGWTADTPGGVAIRVRTGLGEEETTAIYSPDGSCMRVHWRQTAKDRGIHLADLTSWVLDSALGFCARLRGWPVLHGSVVDVDGRAIALLGPKGAGKSTLAAAFLADNCSFLADDHVVLRRDGDAFMAQPGPPYLRLWPTSLPVLGARAEDLPRVYEQVEKRRLAAEGANGNGRRCVAKAMPLRGAYVLEPRDASCRSASVERLPLTSALHQVMLQRWSRMQISSAHAASELDALSHLVRTVPVCRVVRPDGIDSLGEVVREIRADTDRHGD